MTHYVSLSFDLTAYPIWYHSFPLHFHLDHVPYSIVCILLCLLGSTHNIPNMDCHLNTLLLNRAPVDIKGPVVITDLQILCKLSDFIFIKPFFSPALIPTLCWVCSLCWAHPNAICLGSTQHCCHSCQTLGLPLCQAAFRPLRWGHELCLIQS